MDPIEAGTREGEPEQELFYRARDLMRRFSGGLSSDEPADAGGGDSDEIELGLSLGGCFSSRDVESNRLLRSSSIPAVLPSEFPSVVPLVRACSLPSETEEEIRRRKELQGLKRMEAKRKREEKRNNKRVGERSEEGLEVGSTAKMRRFELGNGSSWVPANGVRSPGLPRWVAGASIPTASSACRAPTVSQGSSSSGGSELDHHQGKGFEVSGFSCCSEVRSPARVLPMVKPNSSKASPSPPPSTSPTARPKNGTFIRSGIVGAESLFRENGAGRIAEVGGNEMEEMPSVSTTGVGPNGRRVEGFLYKYRRGEEVRIVCVCHGKFLTPAEFVKHAGGGDVANPLRHIVVNPKPSAFL